MIQALIKQKLDSKQLPYEPCAIVIGNSGVGKTTLVTKLCNKNHESNADNSMKQKEYGRYHVDCCEHRFTIVDTPATDCSMEVYKHAVLLRESLTKQKLNTIFFIIKYDSRFEKMIENYFQLESLVSKYTAKIVVIISYWDQSKDAENEFKEICELFEEECPHKSNLIAYSKQSSDADVVNLMYSCISNMDEEDLVITDEEFTLNFNLYESERSMNKLFEQYQNQVHLILQKNQESIDCKQYQFIEEKHNVFGLIIDNVKCEIEELAQNFGEANVSGMHPLDRDRFLARMKKENSRVYDDFAAQLVIWISSVLPDDATRSEEKKDIVEDVNNSDLTRDRDQQVIQHPDPDTVEQDVQQPVGKNYSSKITDDDHQDNILKNNDPQIVEQVNDEHKAKSCELL